MTQPYQIDATKPFEMSGFDLVQNLVLWYYVMFQQVSGAIRWKPVNPNKFFAWLRDVFQMDGQQVRRVKEGLAALAEDGFLVQIESRIMATAELTEHIEFPHSGGVAGCPVQNGAATDDNVRFNTSEYAKLQGQCAKLAYLAGFAGIGTDMIATILGVSMDAAQSLLDAGLVQGPSGRKLLEDADHLLSVLAYFLELADYQSADFRELLTKENFFASSIQPPCWDEFGLLHYLILNGPSGIRDSLQWIRSH